MKPNLSRTLILVLLFSLLLLACKHPSFAGSKEYEIFDGRVYNGKFYPRVDIIEWKEEDHPNHMEFHLYYKGRPLELSFQLEETTGRKIMLVNYFFPDRREHLCRRVPAPAGFHGQFFVYRDTSDKDFDNIILSTDELPSADDSSGRIPAAINAKPPTRVRILNPPHYTGCEEASESTPTGNPSVTSPTASGSTGIKSSKEKIPFEDW